MPRRQKRSPYAAINLADPQLEKAVRRISRSLTVNEGVHVCAGTCIHLNDSDVKVIEGVCMGLTNVQIGHRLHLSETTIKNRLTRVFTVLGVQSRAQLVILAVRSGLVNIF